MGIVYRKKAGIALDYMYNIVIQYRIVSLTLGKKMIRGSAVK